MALATCGDYSLETAKTSVTRLPTETWMAILRYAISVPVFFDSNPAETHGVEAMITFYFDPKPYYQAERIRNKLRRVCSSWNSYLASSFSHRYVQFSDVRHGDVPVDAIPAAVRLNFDRCGGRRCCSSRVGRVAYEQSTAMGEALEDGLEQWSVEILEERPLGWEDLMPLKNGAPRLRTILDQDADDIDLVVQSFPNILFIGLPSQLQDLTHSLSHSLLTTLTFTMTSLQVCGTWSLPSLKTLSFLVTDLQIKDYLNMASAIGKNLRTLYDGSALSHRILPQELWKLCPNLEQFQTAFKWPTDTIIPKSLRYIRLSSECLEITGSLGPTDKPQSNKHRDSDRLPLSAMRQAGISGTGLDCQWWTAAIGDGFTYYISHGSDNGLRLHDTRGVLFQDWVVDIIRRLWKKEPTDGSFTPTANPRLFPF